MPRFGVGQGLHRVEDERLLTGRGRYSDDVNLPDQAHAVMVRSPFAHAALRGIDAAAAGDAPGVLAIYSGADLAADGIGTLPCPAAGEDKDGRPTVVPPRSVLALDRARHVGEPVAVVIADTLAQARDAAELVDVDYEELPAVVSLATACDAGTPQIWPHAQDNIALDWEMGDPAATAAAFEQAAHVTRLELVNNRVVVNPMEPRAALGDYGADSGQFTLTTNSQSVHMLRGILAEHIFKLPPERFRVVTPDVGGGFGTRFFLYPEHVLVLYAARRLGRPVKWTCERAEGFVTDTHGRDHVTAAELALDGDGHLLGLRVSTKANMGAYLSEFAPYIPTGSSAPMFPGAYRLPAFHAEIKCVYTNTVPVDAYRGAGRSEAAYLLERLVDAAAREMGLPPDEIRRRNFIPPEAMPYHTPGDLTYDSGDFARLMDAAMEGAEWGTFAARCAEAKERGRLRGIGMAYYIEACAGFADEHARLRLDADGGLSLFIGTMSGGQGHATVYMQILHDRFGLAPDLIRVCQGDTGELTDGWGTGGSRSLLMGGMAAEGAADRVIARAREIAGHLLEASEADLELADGAFTVAGTDRRITLAEIAQAANGPPGDDAAHRLPDALHTPIDEHARFETDNLTFPNGCHICELEVDPATGQVRIARYLVVDDFGKVVNPALCIGQVHGGAVQGIGQALMEHTVYEPDSGQLLSGSFMDYCLPRADDVPDLEVTLVEDFPCATNPMGVKGAGEAGAIGAPPALINALLDALAPLGVTHIDMPATPERVWRAIRQAGGFEEAPQ